MLWSLRAIFCVSNASIEASATTAEQSQRGQTAPSGFWECRLACGSISNFVWRSASAAQDRQDRTTGVFSIIKPLRLQQSFCSGNGPVIAYGTTSGAAPPKVMAVDISLARGNSGTDGTASAVAFGGANVAPRDNGVVLNTAWHTALSLLGRQLPKLVLAAALLLVFGCASKPHKEAGAHLQAEESFCQLDSELDMYEQYDCGVKYDNAGNYNEAVRWYRLAAVKGYAPAQFSLGDAYAVGDGVIQNHNEAARWVRAAALQGYVDAQYELAWAYADGYWLPQDRIAAYAWFIITMANVDNNPAFKRSVKISMDKVATIYDLRHRQFAMAGYKARTCLESAYRDCP